MAFSVVLFDDYEARNHLLPLVSTRPVSNLRVGILTLDQKWSLLLQANVSYKTVSHLSTKFSMGDSNEEVLVINSSFLPTDNLIAALKNLKVNQQLLDKTNNWIACKLERMDCFQPNNCNSETILFDDHLDVLNYPEDIFRYNANQIVYDINILNEKANYEPWVQTNQLIGDAFFIQEGVSMQGAILDSSTGAIYIGKNAIIEPGVVIHGPAAIGDNCRLKTGTLIYANVSIGPATTVCGELSNVVIWGHTAKGHHGYLGCAVLGEGCNLGAGTTNSNLKNDWSTVKLYDYPSNSYRDTGLSKCGVVIGDHAMLAIQSKINTGTIIGTGAQVAMSKFIPKFVPDFSWYTDEKLDTYHIDRFIQMMHRKAAVKNEVLTKDDLNILTSLYHQKQMK